MKRIFYKPLLKKIVCSLVIVFVFLLGRNIPLPYWQAFSIDNPFLTLSSLMTGGDLSRLSLFSLGLSPWMYAKLLIRLYSLGKEKSSLLLKQGIYVKVLSLFFALLQSSLLVSSFLKRPFLAFDAIAWATVMLLVAGTFVLMWLMELNSYYGIGQASLLIVAGILSGQLASLASFTWSLNFSLLFLLAWVFLSIYVAVVLEKLSYPLAIKRLAINHYLFKDYSLPLGFNLGRSMSVLYAHSFLLLGQYFLVFLEGYFPHVTDWSWWRNLLSLDSPVGIMLYGVLVVLLTFVFAFLNFDVLTFVRNLQKSGDYIAFVNPGQSSQVYLNRLLRVLSFLSGCLLAMLVTVPWWLIRHHSHLSALASLPGFALALVGMIASIREEVVTVCLPLAYGPIWQDERE